MAYATLAFSFALFHYYPGPHQSTTTAPAHRPHNETGSNQPGLSRATIVFRLLQNLIPVRISGVISGRNIDAEGEV